MKNSGWFQRYTATNRCYGRHYNDIHIQNNYIHIEIIRFTSDNCILAGLNGCNTMGGMGPTASVVFKRIASMIADKTSQSYTSTIRLIRCKLTFSLLRFTITCLRGSRSLSRNEHHLNPADTDLTLVEGRVRL